MLSYPDKTGNLPAMPQPAVQLFNGVASIGTEAASGGGVAYWAHVGGFLTGIVLVRLFAQPVRVQQMGRLQVQPA